MTGIAAQGWVRVSSGSAKVAVAARDGLARTRIANALAEREDLCVCSGASARQLIASTPSTELLVNYCESCGTDELRLFRELAQHRPELMIVAVCESVDARAARRAIDNGIHGLVFARALEASLPATVAAVLRGQIVVPRGLHAAVRNPSLSVRERQILRMVVMGLTNREISNRMYLAESTIKSHLSSAYAKLGARSRSEAAAMILDSQGSLGAGILAISAEAGPALAASAPDALTPRD